MNVRLAAQVLSESVGNMLLQFGPPDAAETAHLCLLMDKFFDCCNVRNTQEYKTKKKPFLKPYSDINDTRFEWLQDVFLKYYSDWKTNIHNRPGNFTAMPKARCFYLGRHTKVYK